MQLRTDGHTAKQTGTERHNTLTAGKTYHSIQRRICKTFGTDFKFVIAYNCLLLATKAVNDSAGHHGLCLSLLIFGILPTLPDIFHREFPTQQERKQAVFAARKGYEKIVGKEMISRGIRTIPPPAQPQTFLPGDFVYAYSEDLKHYVCQWQGGTRDTGENTGPKPFNIVQLRPAAVSTSQYPMPTQDRCSYSSTHSAAA